MAQYKLDIFEVIKNIDAKNTEFYSSLNDEGKKAFVPFLVTRWLSGTNNARQVYFLNEIVNPFLFVAHIQRDHKALLWLLLTITGSGKPYRRSWIGQPKKEVAKPASTRLVAQRYNYSLRDAADAIKCLTGNDILDIADELGVQKEVISEIRKEWKGEDLRADVVGLTQNTKSSKVSQSDDTQEFFEF